MLRCKLQCRIITVYFYGFNVLTNLQVANDKLQLSLQEKFGEKFKQAELDKLIAEKGQIDTSSRVNVATLGKIASDIARNYADVQHINVDTNTINSLRPYIIQKMGIDNIGGKLSNMSTAFDLGLNLKYGDKQKGQQLKSFCEVRISIIFKTQHF